MTAQTPDNLVVRGEVLSLCDTPLREYLKYLPKARRPTFVVGSTANWRAHVATWMIRDGCLFLVGVEGTALMPDGTYIDNPTLEQIFPWARRFMPVNWLTGELICTEGRMRRYVHAGFGSTFERSRAFLIRKGRVESEWLDYNPPGPITYPIRPDGSRGPCHNYAPDPFPDNAPVEAWRLWGDPDFDIEELSDDDECHALKAEWKATVLESVRDLL